MHVVTGEKSLRARTQFAHAFPSVTVTKEVARAEDLSAWVPR